ncbi:MAG TPA: hypothetical protein VG206_03915 [Terriglobia bacterium]|nr:hypothetical protein [Terriglobia bacterium]
MSESKPAGPFEQTANASLIAVRGQLISQHYLTHQLVNRDDWKTLAGDPRVAQIEQLFERAKPSLARNQPGGKGSNESAVRDFLLNPALGILGLRWSPGVSYLGTEPDYALYQDRSTFEKAQSLINDGKEFDALKLSCGVVEAERWGKEFGERPARSDLSDPIFQIEFYLGNARRSGGPRWGLLTNGHTWRLYCGDSDPSRHHYLEVELPTGPSLFVQQERAAFQWLVYLFSAEALEPGGRLDSIYEQATRRAAAITAELRRQAFGAVELIASAIMRASPSASPQLAYEAALIQLFRLLFILKAEADGLLKSRIVSREMAERIINRNSDSVGGGDWQGTGLWHELHDLFAAIAQDYNGHLFESRPPTSSPAADDSTDYFAPARALLESVTLPNQATANALDRLLRVYQQDAQQRVRPIRVDYSTLRVRELGTIYEGLLEWRLEPVSPAQIKAGSVKLLGDKRVTRIVEDGDYTLVADQSDRKATGSYYTPHYVVEFIGENTLKPLLEQIEQECADDPARIICRVLDLRILDPAMGSGHFLVFAVEYLADYVFLQLGRLRAQPKASNRQAKQGERPKVPIALDASIDFIRTRVAERCVYGVDINPLAVELTKLSLWVATAAKGVPLSFLNHHLRCGDSLLGVFSTEFHHDLFAQKLVQQMALAVGHIRLINDLFTHTLEDVGKKEEELRMARDLLRRFRLTYDCQLAPLFGVDIGEGFHAWLDDVTQPVPERLPPWLRAVEKIASQYRFFHWELEFPEVWRDRYGRPLDSEAAVCDRRTATDEIRRSQSAATAPERLAGFDVVLGNPPFVLGDDRKVRDAYRNRFETAREKFSLVVPFFEQAFRLLRQTGRLGFIVSNSFTKREFGKRLVENFLPAKELQNVVDCSGLSFPGHGTPTLIAFARNRESGPDSEMVVAGGLKGDLLTPPEDTELWRSLSTQFNQPGYSDKWVAVTARLKAELASHPWVFDLGNQPTKALLEAVTHKSLRDLLDDDVGFDCVTAANDIYLVPIHLARRYRVPSKYLLPLAIGEDLRDYQFRTDRVALWPYGKERFPELSPEVEAYLTPFRPHLETRSQFHKTQLGAGLKWYEYREYHREGLGTRVAYPEVATHNHFLVSGPPRVFNQKTPLLHVPTPDGNLDQCWCVMAVMNSSATLFWLKQVCFNKGAGQQEHKDRYEFQGNKLHATPIPNAVLELGSLRSRCISLTEQCVKLGTQATSLAPRLMFDSPGEAYDGWNRALLSYVPPHRLIAQHFDSRQEVFALKAKAREERERLRREMIALQEEMDWLLYAAYGLLPEDHRAVGLGVMNAAHPWEVALGQRPFELLAIHAGPPADWDEPRKKLWEARVEVIRSNEHVARIEQAVYKRRWMSPDYEKEFAEAFRWWLREKAEFYLEHQAGGGPVSLREWAEALWKDRRVRAAAEVYQGEGALNATYFEPILKEAVEEETVPDDETAFKQRHRQLRGKLNVPRERFRSLTKKPGLYVWAGKA